LANDGQTLLHVAAHSCQKEIVALLIKRGANVDGNKAMNNTTPLIWAACFGSLDVVKLLVEAGADTEAKTDTGTTALAFATQRDHFHVVQYLLSKGANPTSPNQVSISSTLNARIFRMNIFFLVTFRL